MMDARRIGTNSKSAVRRVKADRSPKVLIQKLPIVIVLTVVVGLVGAWLISDSVQVNVQLGFDALRSGDRAQITEFLRSFGRWAPVVSIGLMIAQAVAAPIPGMLIMFANGLAFGVFWGGVVTLIGQVLAASLCFWLARSFGRDTVLSLIGRFGLESADRWMGRWGTLGIIGSRLVPGVSFDAVSYLAGLTGIGFARFTALTVIGSAPQAFLYAWLIQSSPKLAWYCIGVMMAVMTGGVLAAIVRSRLSHHTISGRKSTHWREYS